MITARAYAKLNLFLHITGKRDDGYHLLDTLMAFAEYGDEISVTPADGLLLNIDGPFAAGLEAEKDDNLVLKAARALQRESGVNTGAAIRLTKNLPLASGMGGGSADAAATLRALNELWGLEWPEARLAQLAATLGSDVGACVASVSVRARGVGDALSLQQLPGPVWAVLVNPLIAVPTPDVYRAMKPPYAGNAPVCDAKDVDALMAYLRRTTNDLEVPARGIAPVIGELIASLRALPGCAMAQMSGSGATCFGLFAQEENALLGAAMLERAWPDYWIKSTRLREGYAD